ncbi:MAG: RNA methyltransferase [Neisseria zoodegmatis]|uniref:TrmH family RNA methyltransferase n=1 Tax=Neisseria zoodegmatis TaxID=326523 RepID=UPI0026EC7391|nr:RNA methyltransferase [Neisseria zoodegmatis]MDO5069476.1 RNA methyltransferase [Neisseria zoodegmatis]
MKLITSARNEQLKHLSKLLSQTKARRQHGQTVLEGIHLLQSYLQSGRQPVQVYIPETKKDLPEISAAVKHLPPQSLTLAADGVLSKISGLTEAEDLITLIDIPVQTALPTKGDCVVLERVQDPGNVGTIMRSAAAAGVKELILSHDCADVWAPKVLRAGMGAHFLLDIHDRADLPEWSRRYTGNIWATALSETDNHNLYDMRLTKPAAWVFGNEGSGISPEIRRHVHGCVKIPMLGQTESLNVAMAATVCLFEQMRQRLHTA